MYSKGREGEREDRAVVGKLGGGGTERRTGQTDRQTDRHTDTMYKQKHMKFSFV